MLPWLFIWITEDLTTNIAMTVCTFVSIYLVVKFFQLSFVKINQLHGLHSSICQSIISIKHEIYCYHGFIFFKLISDLDFRKMAFQLDLLNFFFFHSNLGMEWTEEKAHYNSGTSIIIFDITVAVANVQIWSFSPKENSTPHRTVIKLNMTNKGIITWICAMLIFKERVLFFLIGYKKGQSQCLANRAA